MAAAARGPDAPATAPPLVTDDAVAFRLPADAVAGAAAVELFVDWTTDQPLTFAAEPSGDRALTLARPLAHRFEYQLLVHGDDGEQYRTDPTNPRTVPGPFGDKSEIVFPDYRPPSWLGTPATGTTTPIDDNGTGPGDRVPVRLFAPDGLPDTVPAPLLLAHDGSDMAARGDLLSWACAQPQPLRVALLDPAPGHRDQWYAADAGYADHVAGAVLDALTARVATSATVGLGASLGALAMLTVHRRHPESLDGLALQSGSFFTAELDPQEASWPQFERVCTAVGEIADALPVQVHPVPVLMTVGAIEENRANNEQLAGALAFQGYPVDARIVPDAHTMIGWRDAWAPGLDDLVAAVRRSVADRSR